MNIYDSPALQKIRVTAITETETGKYCGYILSVFGATVSSLIEPDGENPTHLIGALNMNNPGPEKIPGKAKGSGYNKETYSLAEFLRKNCTVSDEEIRVIEAGQINKFFTGRGLSTYIIL